jgi:hypothetical protein
MTFYLHELTKLVCKKAFFNNHPFTQATQVYHFAKDAIYPTEILVQLKQHTIEKLLISPHVPMSFSYFKPTSLLNFE